MTSKTTSRFWRAFEQLPAEVQTLARDVYRRWREDPFHSSFRFKPVRPGIWSIRIGLHYRALAQRQNDVVRWIWIGTHAEYDRLLHR